MAGHHESPPPPTPPPPRCSSFAQPLGSRLLLFPIRGDSERIFFWYLEKFRRPGDELIFLAMVEHSGSAPHSGSEPLLPEHTKDPLIGAAIIAGQKNIQRFVKMSREAQLPSRGIVKLGGACQCVIVEMVQEEGVNAVLLGSSSAEDKEEAIGVSQYVMTHCPNISVTIVPHLPGQLNPSLYKQFIDNFF